jgi:hypothetical protein
MILWTVATGLILELLKTPACGGEACERAAANIANLLATLPVVWVVAMVVGLMLLVALWRGQPPRSPGATAGE